MSEKFSVGSVLGTGIKVWSKNFVPFTLITLLIYLPLLIWGAFLVQGEIDVYRAKTIAEFMLYSALLSMLMNVFVSAALTYGVVMELQGKRASVGACISTGFSRLLPAMGVALLSGLAIGAGFVCLIVPGVILTCMLYVATPVSVIERPGVTASLKRSRELTAGYKDAIFGLIFVLGIIGYGLSAFARGSLVPSDPAGARAALPMYMYVSLGLQILLGSLGSVMAAVAYYYLRNQKEGTTATELAKVFE